MVLSQPVRQSLTLYQHGADAQQMFYVLQMPPAAISHLYSHRSECGTAGTYHPGHRWRCWSHVSLCSLKVDDIQKRLLHLWTPSASIPAGVGAWWMQVCHSEKDKVIACTQLDDAHLSDVKWTVNCHIRYKRLNPLKRDQIKDVFFLPTKSNTQYLLSKVQWLLKWGMIGWSHARSTFHTKRTPWMQCHPFSLTWSLLSKCRWVFVPAAGNWQGAAEVATCWGAAGGPLFACQVRVGGSKKKNPKKQLPSLSKQIWNHGPEFCMELCQQPWKACEKGRLGGPEATCSPVAPRPAARSGRGAGPGWAGAWPGLLLPLAWLGLSLRHLL